MVNKKFLGKILRNKKFLGILAVIIVVVVAGTYYANTSSANTINQGYMPATGDALIFIAQENGYFKEQGLNVHLYQFQLANDEINAMLSNKLDVVAGGVGQPLSFINNGKDLEVIGGIMGGDSAVITKTNETANELRNNSKNYEGKTIATVKMSTPDVVIKGALQDEGVNLTKVTFVDLKTPGDVITAVKTGKADAGFVWPNYQYTAQEQGLVIAKFSDEYVPNHPCCRVTTTQTEVKNNREKWVKYEKALIESYNYYKTNQDGSAAIVGKYVKMDQASIKTALYDGHLSLVPDPNRKGTSNYWNLIAKVGYVQASPSVNLDEHIDTTIYKEALDELVKENPDNQNYKDLETIYQEQDT